MVTRGCDHKLGESFLMSKNKITRLASGLLTAVALVSTFTVGVSNAAFANSKSLPEGTVVFYSLESQDSYYGTPILDRSSATAPRVQTRLNPVTIGLCNSGFGEVVVSSFTSKFDGAVKLKCGDSAAGYVHIRTNHRSQWQAQMGGPGLWDDYMVWASAQALSAPSLANTQAGNKRCYTTPIEVFQVINGAQTYWKTIRPSVVVSMNNKIVITSIPSTVSTC